MSRSVADFDSSTVGLYLVLALSVFAGLYMLSGVFWTMFLAVTFAYVLFPVASLLYGKGLSRRQSAALTTVGCLSVLSLLVIPVFLVLFRRRGIITDFLVDLPEEFSVEVLEYSFTYSTEQLEVFMIEWLSSTAIRVAEGLPSLLLRFLLFVFLLYALLRYPEELREAVLSVVPVEFRDAVSSYHERIDRTLVGVFTVQAFTSVLTFFLALPVFYFLGYEPFIFLSLICALLQFIPVIGPSLLILGLVLVELFAGVLGNAILVLVLGFAVIAFLPDAYLRPRMADRTTGLPASLYFLGFVGGGLTLGAVGVLAGPLVIALLLETVEILDSQEL